MSAHEQFAEDLALYALGALQGEERSVLERHLSTCHDCALELDYLRGDMALLALSTAGPQPTLRSRERLLKAVSREAKQHFTPKEASRWSFLPWVLAATLVVVAGFLWHHNIGLEKDLAELRTRSQQQKWQLAATSDVEKDVAELQRRLKQQEGQLRKAREILSTLTASDALRVTLVAAKTPPQPQGKAFFVKQRASLIFLASNMAALPTNKSYQLWVIPKQGAPVSAGLFKPDARGSATLIEPPLPAHLEPKAFAITVEPEAGSPAPTSKPILLGAGE